MNILKTDRLTLRQTNKNDITDIYEKIFKNKNVVKYTFGSDFFSFEEANEFIKNKCNFDKTLGLSTLVENSTNSIVGLAGAMECNHFGNIDYEIGFILDEKTWGKGYATEIGRAQIEFVRDRLKAKRVLAIADSNNIGSIKCIEKLELKFHSSIEIEVRGSRNIYILEF